MKKYEVLSPYVVFPVKGENGKKKEYALKKGDTVDLPENDISVKALLTRKQIVETAPQPPKEEQPQPQPEVGDQLKKTEGKNSKK